MESDPEDPPYIFGPEPHQYTMAQFQRLRQAVHDPLMAEIILLSSHSPWAPLPTMLDWNSVGNGSVYNGMPEKGESASGVVRSRDALEAAYTQTVAYSLSTLISY